MIKVQVVVSTVGRDESWIKVEMYMMSTRNLIEIPKRSNRDVLCAINSKVYVIITIRRPHYAPYMRILYSGRDLGRSEQFSDI